MKKNAQLILFQIDHLSGEEIAHLINRAYIWGAHNVHAIPTVTKKGRPGYIILADIGDQKEIPLVQSMAKEFGLFGYHEIRTVHWHQSVATHQRKLRIRYKQQEIALIINFKFCGSEKAPFYTRIEHDDVVAVQDRVESAFGQRISHHDLRQRLNALAREKNLVLDLDNKPKGKAKAR